MSKEVSDHVSDRLGGGCERLYLESRHGARRRRDERTAQPKETGAFAGLGL